MDEKIILEFDVDGDNFVSAGAASEAVKRTLKQLNIPREIIRKVAIAMYEGEINMVIHGKGGKAKVEIGSEEIFISLIDEGPGIADIEWAMREGNSTANDNIRSLGFGAGMGLPNIKKNSDSLEITSEVGKGTTVNIKVKLV